MRARWPGLGGCTKPVNMTQPHGALVRYKRTGGPEDNDVELDWFDVLAVLCAECARFFR